MAGEFRRISYRSTPCARFGPLVLLGLQRNCARRNLAVGITAFLYCDERGIFQVLEGPPCSVEEVVARIRRDSRHAGVEVLSEAACDARLFPRWAFGATNSGDREYRRAAHVIGCGDFWELDPAEAARLLSTVASRKRRQLQNDLERFRTLDWRQSAQPA